LIRSERQLNLTSHGRLAAGRLGTEVRYEAIRAGVTSSLAAFCGALLPLMAAALAPQHHWIAILSALLALAALGFALARAVHGSSTRWSLGLVAGGILLSLLGAFLKII
jgi:VIT1/CCC1 family predicted Fe2+/Mn2+ transporter